MIGKAKEHGTLLKNNYLLRTSNNVDSGVMNGLALILHEIQMDDVGFKGMAFFTLSWSFIGSVRKLSC